MFMFWFFTLFVYTLSHEIQLSNGATLIMVLYALISDLLLYSLVSQWVKKRRQNVGSWNIHKNFGVRSEESKRLDK